MKTRKLFNWKKRLANRERARHWMKIGRNQGSDFLAQAALDDLALRLSTLERSFENALILDAPSSELASAIEATIKQKSVDCRCTSILSDGPSEPETLSPNAANDHDFVISFMGLQDYDNLPDRLFQIRQCLKPDGLFFACLIGNTTLTELRQSLFAVEPEVFGGAKSRIHPMIEVRDMGGLLQKAGLALPVADVENYTVHYNDVFALIQDLRAMGATQFLQQEGQERFKRDFWPKVNAYYKAHFANENARLRASFDIVWVSGWAPAASQQKPLKRGSATHSLKDVLKDLEQN